MNHPKLVERMAAALGLTRAEADKVVRVITRAIAQNALASKRVELRGFGTFSAFKTAARPARNFHSGARIIAAPHLKLKFKPSKRVTPALLHFRAASSPPSPSAGANEFVQKSGFGCERI